VVDGEKQYTGRGEPAGVLKVSMAPTFGMTYVMPLLPAFLTRYPMIRRQRLAQRFAEASDEVFIAPTVTVTPSLMPIGSIAK
jgi:DNA-binding transcriptional LysR family regulator